MKVLDLFCCCGGAAKGLSDAGFEVTGVDITDNHEYPYDFVHSNVFDLDPYWIAQFDLIWASPPCQAYSWGTRKGRTEKFPDLVDRTRQLLQETGKSFIIENVIGAPITKNLLLCGEMFGLRVLRHRIFEIHGFRVLQPKHEKHKQPLDKTHSFYACVSGHGGDGYSFRLEDWQQAIGIDHITKKEHLTQAVPPKYSEYIAGYIK